MMGKFLFYLTALSLFALGLLTGGCSLFFTPEMVKGTMGGISLFWFGGIVLAALAIWGGVAALRGARK